MPVHDWSKVSAGIFHDFHISWIVELKNALNNGLLPPDYYALAEQKAADVIPDVLTLQVTGGNGDPKSRPSSGGVALAVAPPKVRFTASAETDFYAMKQRTIAIRHSSDDRIIALIEIISKGNKSGNHAFRELLDKAVAALAHGQHLLLIDLQPRTSRDPQGIHGAIWGELCDERYMAPSDKPLTLASYAAGSETRAFIEPVAAGDRLPNMPLFLDPERYVDVALESTYEAAYHTVPQRWRKVLE